MSGVAVTVGGNASQALAMLDGVARKAESIAEKIKTGFQERIGHRLFDGLASAAARLPDALSAAIKAASDMGETVSKTNVVFQDSAAAMHAWAANSADAFGLSSQAALAAASDMGNLFVAMGLGPEKAAGMSRSMVELAADLASFNNTSIDDALVAIGSALRGEAEPIARYGVLLNEATLKAEAFAQGISNGKDTLSPANKALAAFNVILSQTGTAQGDFARTSEGLANSVRIIQARISDATAEFGEAFLPVVQDVANKLKTMDMGSAARDAAQAVGGLVQAFLALLPTIKLAAASFAALKLTSFISGLVAKAAAWWASTAAVQANTAALRQNAAAGAAAGASKAGGMMGMISGGALAAAAIGFQMLTAATEKLEAANRAMAESFARGQAAAEKFNVGTMRGQVASRAEIEKTIEAIQAEQDALNKAAQEQAAAAPDFETSGRILEDARVSVELLEIKKKLLRQTSDEQLAANKAVRDAAAAEAEYQKALEQSVAKYEAAKKTFEQTLAANEKERINSLPLEEQLIELEKAEAALRKSFNSQIQANFGGASSAEIAAALESGGNSTERGAEMERVNQLLDIETRRAEIQRKLAEEKEKEAESAAKAAEEYKKSLDEAEAAARRARDDARNSSRALVEEAEAMVAGPQAMADLARARRAAELQEQTGMGSEEAKAIAGREQAFENLRSLQSRQEGLQYQSAFSSVDSMRRLGGGGGVAASGIDYARQQTELQRQMVAALHAVREALPRPSLED